MVFEWVETMVVDEVVMRDAEWDAALDCNWGAKSEFDSVVSLV